MLGTSNIHIYGRVVVEHVLRCSLVQLGSDESIADGDECSSFRVRNAADSNV